MTLEEIFMKVGTALDENDLREYGDKIFQCADSVQREIAVFAAPIVRNCAIESKDGQIQLPEDCYEVIGLLADGKKITFINHDDDTLSAKEGQYILKYNAYPPKITEEKGLDQKIEISDEGAEAMVYGICAGLCINDEPELYTAYMDRYNGLIDAILTRKSRFPFAQITGGVVL